jgi:hypothetical protein
VDGLEDVAHDIGQVRFPAPEEPPYSGIPVQYNGFRCLGKGNDSQQCRHVVAVIQKMQEHCREVHGWKNEQRRGGNAKGKKTQTANRMWDNGQVYQRFFNEPPWKRNTPVTIQAGDGSTSSNSGNSGTSGTRQDVVQLFDQLLTQKEAEGKEQRQR